MPKSFLLTNKRFTSQRNNGLEKSCDNFKEPETTTAISMPQEEANDVNASSRCSDETNATTEEMDMTTTTATEQTTCSPVKSELPRKEYTLPIIKQKERYRNFEIAEFNDISIRPPAYYSFEVTRDAYEYNRGRVGYQSPVSEISSPIKHCDTSDGESDSGISLISEDSRPSYSPKNDYSYHCSEHLSLLLDFFSPRKPVVREAVVEERPEIRRALNFDMPSFQAIGNGNLEELTNCSTSDDDFICNDCGKRYSTSSNLARHRQTHRSSGDKKARQCPHCDKVYVSMPAFSMHVRTHNQGCECHICGKKFSRPWLLQGHIRTHTGEKPFSCPQCSKCFADKSNLRAHVQTHSTEKPYVCGRCGKAFALKSYLYKHEESSCMRGQRSSHKRPRNNTTAGAATGQLAKVMFPDEQRRSSW